MHFYKFGGIERKDAYLRMKERDFYGMLVSYFNPI